MATKAASSQFKKPRKKVSTTIPMVGGRPDLKALVRQQVRLQNTRTEGFMGIENKFVDYNVQGQATSTGWAGGELDPATALCISVVAQGDGENQRDGRMYNINSWYIKGFLSTSASEAQAGPQQMVLVRIVVVLDTQTNGAQLNAEDVFTPVAAGVDVCSVRNLQFSKRFRVLKDRTMKLNPNIVNEGAVNAFAAGASSVPFKMGGRFKTPLKVRCSGTTAAIASVTDNSIHVIGVSNSATGLLTYISRCRFTG